MFCLDEDFEALRARAYSTQNIDVLIAVGENEFTDVASPNTSSESQVRIHSAYSQCVVCQFSVGSKEEESQEKSPVTSRS